MSKLLQKKNIEQENSFHISQVAADIAAQIATHAAVEEAHQTLSPIIYPSSMMGRLGFVLDQSYGSAYSVLFSDVNAGVMSSFFVQDGGSFKVTFMHIGSGANNGLTASGIIYVSYDVDQGAATWDVNAQNFDLGLENANVQCIDTYGTAFTVSDNSKVGVYWAKDDNAGGAAGTMYIHGMVLVRQ